MYLKVLLLAALLGLAACNDATEMAVPGDASSSESVASDATNQPVPVPVIYVPVRAPSESSTRTPS
ncbi:MAG: hypothetical protein AAAB35_01675 [Phyllobacterium sp.]|uniref:hypothetical protein n=1 Tax=Phyllobacterium sp. TaxID=1871046 RepID=UPI0030F0E925